jgi:aryl sulfotransferase
MVDVRNLPNVLPVHFNNLKADLPGQIRRIAGFLDVDIDETSWPRILEHCGFDYMRSIMAEDEMMASMWTGGGRTFINKGTNGRWKDVLTSEEIAKAELLAAQHLTPECARWLATGAMAD